VRKKSKPQRLIEPVERRVLLSSVIYVDANASGSLHDGMSWTSAFTDLQQGLAAAVAGDAIHVADGTYKPGVNADVSATFQLLDGVMLLGGYAGGGSVNPNARDVKAFQSVLSGEISKSNASYHVVTGSGCDASAILDGFTITKGKAMDGRTGNTTGAGMFNEAGSPTVRNCTFTANLAFAGSSSVYNHLSLATFTDCTFSESSRAVSAVFNGDSTVSFVRCGFVGNSSIYGAMENSGSSTIVQNCVFDRNVGHWGALTNFGGSMLVNNCVFSGNITDNTGGAIEIDNGNVTIRASIFAGNQSQFGGAISCEADSLLLENCTFTGNYASDTGNAICCWVGRSSIQVRNSILWDGGNPSTAEIAATNNDLSSVHVASSDVRGGWNGADNIDHDPGFIRSYNPGLDGVRGTSDDDFGDLRLSLSSACLDAGDNALVSPGVTSDLAGNLRIVDVPTVHDPGAIVDMGAYERVAPFADGWLAYDSSTQSVAVRFSADVLSSSLAASELVLINATTGLAIDCGLLASVSYDAGSRTAVWSFATPLPDGNYHATLPANSATDPQGQPVLSSDLNFDFFVLAADANRDRKVDISDLSILAMNWQGSGKAFSQGDFNYDGKVDAKDLGILSTHWQSVLAPPISAAPVGAGRTPTRTATRVAKLVL
jgi:predicted outer membrane repeat protein